MVSGTWLIKYLNVIFLRNQGYKLFFPSFILIIFLVLFLFEFIAQKCWLIAVTEVSSYPADLKGKVFVPR